MTVFGMDSRVLFTGVVAALAAERLVELLLSAHNRRRLLERGGVEVGVSHYRWMVLLHASFLAAAPLEVWLLKRPWLPVLATAMTGVLIGTMALRYWVVATLGERWCTRVVVLPGASPVGRGPYRFLRHPNYVAVVLELLAVPLIHTAWLTSIVYSVGNALVLAVRIPAEEAALRLQPAADAASRSAALPAEGP